MSATDDPLGPRHVSRETRARLESYVALLLKWNSAINLIGKTTADAVWSRHILDSLQILDLTDIRSGHWADLGSGAGLPGLVLAIVAAEERPDLTFTLVESDARKAAFLMTAARTCGVAPRIVADRIEKVAPLGADILSARALAPLPALLGFAERHLLPDGTALFPKGANWRQEVDAALESWRFSYQNHPSVTDPGSVILSIRGLSRV